MKSEREGFTLIELLIVIAIILILIAIAVPNFLDARVRAQVARSRADMRTVATAVEAYHADFNQLLDSWGPFAPSLFMRLRPLTTPIEYLDEIPKDPFQPLDDPYWNSPVLLTPNDPIGHWDTHYVFNQGDSSVGSSHGSNDPKLSSAWSLTGAGPDHTIIFPYYYFAVNFSFASNGQHPSRFAYNPTNGARSKGEIFLRGGHYPTHE